MSFTIIWLLLLGGPLLLGLFAQMRVSRTFKRYSEVRPLNGMTGAQAAQAVLAASGLEGVSIRPIDGRLTDHYNPRDRTLNLSADVGQASSIAAIGVAAHEAGHAIQDAQGYRPMRIRQTLVPAAQIGSSLWLFPVIIGLVIGLTGLVTLGLVLFSAIVLFQLVTLPVEFDASKRALVALENQGLLGSERDRRGALGAECRRADLRRGAGRLARPAHLLLPPLAPLTRLAAAMRPGVSARR